MKVIFWSSVLLYGYFLCVTTTLLSKNVPFKLGVENIPASLSRKICPNKKDKCCVGLITNQTGVDQSGVRTVDILKDKDFQVRYMFVPEHGLTGVSAERDVHDSVDTKTSVPVISLYKNGSGKMITSEHMQELDAIFFDIQDSGMRHYTYISTLLNAMKVAAEYDKPFVVLDRPNPLGSAMEGPLVDKDLISFISVAPIPLRHGMTIGELAWYFNTHIVPKKVPLHVVKMRGYDRSLGFMGNFLHQLSPNIQSLQSCLGYSFLGLVGEIEPFDVGIGTLMAFRCITLPESIYNDAAMWKRLQELLRSFGLESFMYRYSKKNKRINKGLRLEFSDISNMHAFELFIALMQFFKKEGITFSFSASFNKAVGTKHVQDVIAGVFAEKLFFDQVQHDLRKFYVQAQSSFLYQPTPVISMKLSSALQTRMNTTEIQATATN